MFVSVETLLSGWPLAAGVGLSALAAAALMFSRGRGPAGISGDRAVRGGSMGLDELVSLEALAREARSAAMIATAELDERLIKVERAIERAEALLARLDEASTGVSSGESHVEEAISPLELQVADMARSGRSALEIARDLGEHTGKIELLVALSKAR